MSTINIIKELVSQDKKARIKVQALNEKYELFLKDLNLFRAKEEQKFIEAYDVEIKQLKAEYKKHLDTIEAKLKAQSESMNKYNEIKDFDQEVLTLFNQVLKVK